MGWILGNGDNISVSNDRWIPCERGHRKPVSHVINVGLKISDLWTTDKQWNFELIRNIFYDPTDVDNIMKMYIPRHDKEDKRL